MTVPADSAAGIHRLRSLAHHADRVDRGLGGPSLALLLPSAQPEPLGLRAGAELLAAHDWDVDRALAAYRARSVAPAPDDED